MELIFSLEERQANVKWRRQKNGKYNRTLTRIQDHIFFESTDLYIDFIEFF